MTKEEIELLENKLNKFLEQYEQEKDINRNVVKKVRQPGNLYHIVVCRTDLLTPFQDCPINDVAFNLDKPTAGHLKDKLVKVNSIKLKRELIGLYYASKMSEDYEFFKKQMDTFTKVHLHQLEKAYGFSYAAPDLYGECYLTYKRPNNKYFTLDENSHSVEIRAYSSVVQQPFFVTE
jgi:galactitol-specific phosphotransferase system IIB component